MRETDRHSFEEWARGRQQAMLRTAYLVTGDLHRAEDLLQEALVAAAQRWGTLREGNPEAWVRTVVARRHISWWRKHRRETLTDAPAGAGEGRTPAADPSGRVTGRVVLLDALDRLTAKQRSVLVLRFLEDLSVAETAHALGVTTGTVKRQTSVALERLRDVAPELRDLVEENR
ncbi:SigE family RNA polymerase sigma factor [Nocardioides bruguierae]|uniref:SigE family RNA polymerase sigma factor n=1 Tax=Nocardioides bruguierae TaxID=2945102 RepID=A0A9X2D6B6_9ACTN|nr:SigE family RNA polymerase sigma factor [Nocardioides bruguierae]MCM0620173.1 SigE family RNA polymerase sigma factor [Nocardioides bruguierae]